MLNNIIFESYWLMIGRICVTGDISVWRVIGVKAATVFIFHVVLMLFTFVLTL